MINRGKFHSLTMINWNGFFARTFDLDSLVTTLSGGNGAGKSTVMASFITALIPDQTLLHFRNTTEAGSSSSSRDKGLHGKLKPGTCYSALEVINSRSQRLIYAVKLQQIAGRDKKVDIKPILIKGLPTSIRVSELFIEAQPTGSAKVRTIGELKDFSLSIEGVEYKTPSSVTDYHADMFEFGVLPKRLRSQADRGKFYRLIEASLYGGISSTITRSLREYLLPQNAGVKKAFQDMEGALRENRMTLEAIAVTQRDRTLFKHLITQTTDYVAADFVRNANQRKDQVTQAVHLRRGIQDAQLRIKKQQQQLDIQLCELETLQEDERNGEIDYQAAYDHLQRTQSAMRQQEKIDRYQDECAELGEKFEEQQMLVEELDAQYQEAKEQQDYYDGEADSLKSQLADYQQALDVQQTRVLQYQQAEQALEKARILTEDPTLNLEKAQEMSQKLESQKSQLTEELLSLTHQLDMAQAARQQFDEAFRLVSEISGDNVTSSDAANVAKTLLQKADESKSLLSAYDVQLSQYQSLQTAQKNREQALSLSSQYQGIFNVSLASEEDLDCARTAQEETLENLAYQQQDMREEMMLLSEKRQLINEQIKSFDKQIPAWVAANDALETLIEQTESVSIEASFLDSHSLTDGMQQVLNAERVAVNQRDAINRQIEDIDAQIERLTRPGGTQDPRVSEIAHELGGVVLSEIYDEITMEDAPHYSALYGPASQSIVLTSFDGVAEKLAQIEVCPEDLYLLQGDPNAFEDVCSAIYEGPQGLCVKVSDRQLRYTQYPQVPVLGSAAREKRLEDFYTQKEVLNAKLASVAFDAQKLARLYQRYTAFMADHIQVAFENDPELERDELQERLAVIDTQIAEKRAHLQLLESQKQRAQEGIQLLNRLEPLASLLDKFHIKEEVAELAQRLKGMQDAKDFMTRFSAKLEKLDAIRSALYADPKQFDTLSQERESKDLQLQEVKRLAFVIADLIERRHHFDYQDALDLVQQSSEFKDQLKEKLKFTEEKRSLSKDKLQQFETQLSRDRQILVSLKSACQTKQETLEEFQRELAELGMHFEPLAVENAELRKEALYEQLNSIRQRRTDLEKAMTTGELKIKTCIKEVKQGSEAYKALRTIATEAKRGLARVFSLVRYAQLEKRLYRRDLTLLKPEQLRSMSDKALGALRQAVADNETLRDALRASEEAGKPEKKVQFYLAVYQHLKERIRQDIIQTDDPVEAIEEMEVELARLTHELTQREQRLAISSDSVASVIRKTIQREQNRIRLLNQGLEQVGFGQVKGVRLAVSIRETHLALLDSLTKKEERHQDLFTDATFSFSEAMAKLYQRLNPHIDTGQRSAQTLGDELLDYRNYLELSIEVNRGSDGWLRAESGALSTGEAIGTGQAILLMVMQSWEEESRRLRSKDILPCRLLFLDEAARLDAKSIATLFELCERLQMQLLIAAPENISPEKGTTYKLIRKISGNKEQVHVVGLKGFAG